MQRGASQMLNTSTVGCDDSLLRMRQSCDRIQHMLSLDRPRVKQERGISIPLRNKSPVRADSIGNHHHDSQGSIERQTLGPEFATNVVKQSLGELKQ